MNGNKKYVRENRLSYEHKKTDPVLARVVGKTEGGGILLELTKEGLDYFLRRSESEVIKTL